MRVALTGGIATGKSYVLASLDERGVRTIDADAVTRDVQRANGPALAEIRNRFGPCVLLSNGELDRPALAARVFDDPTARAALEAIVHPRVRVAIDTWFERVSRETFAVAAIPLLFETGRQDAFDHVIVTACRPALQLKRVIERDGSSEEAAQQRIAAQLPTTDKVERADSVIWTDGSFDETDRQIEDVYTALVRRATVPRNPS